MDQVVDVLNRAAESWSPYVFHAMWQSSLIAIVVLAVVAAFRRLSSPLRYALLLIVLVKFAIPPMLAAPTGLFSRLRLPATDLAGEHPIRLAKAEPDDPGVAFGLVPSHGSETAIEAPADGGISRRAPIAAANAVGTTDPTMIPSAGRSSWLHQTHWQTWLMLVHGLGSLTVGAWVVVHLVRLSRIVHDAEEVVSGALHDDLVRLSRKLGMRRRVRLFFGPGAAAPMAFGPIRPAVLVPAGVIRDLSREETAAILAHELAHHRRFDSWVNCLQIAVAAVWWFNPLVWLLNRSIRNAREDCCDDLILDGKLTTHDVYGETLVRLAEVLSPNTTRARTLGYVQPMHPLRKRLIRVMDAGLSRTPRLSLAGCLLVVTLGGLLLPGIAMRAEEPRPPEEPRGESVAPAEVDEEPAAMPTVSLAGRVIDPEGNPLPGVRVRSYVERWLNDPIFDEAHTTTDEEGRFRLTGLREWGPLSSRAPFDETRGERSLIFEHPDFAIARFREARASLSARGFDLERIRVPLLEQTSFSGVVTDEQGHPISGAVVHISGQERRDTGGIMLRWARLYSLLWHQEPITTDAEGRFRIEKLPVLSIVGIRVEHPEYATFDSWNVRPKDGPYPYDAGDHDLHVRLSPGATIQGRLVRDGKPLNLEGVRIRTKDTTGLLRSLSSALTDVDGRYTISGLPDGKFALRAEAWRLNEAGLAAVPVLEFRAEAGDVTQEIDLVCVEARVLTGRVIDSKSGRPIVGKHVRADTLEDGNVSLGGAKTDENGRYRLLLAPGDCVVVTYEWWPDGRGRNKEVTKAVSVPSEGAVPEVDFAITARPEYPGRLVDEAGRPLAGTVGIDRDPIETLEDGTFRVPEPWSLSTGSAQYSGHALSRDKSLGVSFVWKPGSVEQPFELVLRPLVTIRGRVVDERGNPVADAEAWVVGSPSGGSIRGRFSGLLFHNLFQDAKDGDVRADGTFEFRNLLLPQDGVLGIEFRWQRHSNVTTVVWKHGATRELADLKPGEIRDLGDVALEFLSSGTER